MNTESKFAAAGKAFREFVAQKSEGWHPDQIPSSELNQIFADADTFISQTFGFDAQQLAEHLNSEEDQQFPETSKSDLFDEWLRLGKFFTSLSSSGVTQIFVGEDFPGIEEVVVYCLADQASLIQKLTQETTIGIASDFSIRLFDIQTETNQLLVEFVKVADSIKTNQSGHV